MIENKLKSINPKNNILLSSWDVPSLNDIDMLINETAKAQTDWSKIDLISRLDFVKNLSHILNERANEFSILMADEIGKPKKQGKREIRKCALLCDYYFKNSEQILNDKHIETEFHKSLLLIGQ